jgi:hypothetical protein
MIGSCIKEKLIAQSTTHKVELVYRDDDYALLIVSVYDHGIRGWMPVIKRSIMDEDELKAIRIQDLEGPTECPICGSELLHGRCPNPVKH